MADITKINLDEKEVKEEIMQPLENKSPSAKSKYLLSISVTLAVLIGLVSGFYFAKSRLLLASNTNADGVVEVGASGLKAGAVYGADQEDTFRDKAEGILQPGGIGGEGSHHLERGDNESQWVYITSTVVDLDQFAGAKVTVWGETIQGKKAGWLMDVGRLKVEEPSAAPINAIESSPIIEE